MSEFSGVDFNVRGWMPKTLEEVASIGKDISLNSLDVYTIGEAPECAVGATPHDLMYYAKELEASAKRLQEIAGAYRYDARKPHPEEHEKPIMAIKREHYVADEKLESVRFALAQLRMAYDLREGGHSDAQVYEREARRTLARVIGEPYDALRGEADKPE